MGNEYGSVLIGTTLIPLQRSAVVGWRQIAPLAMPSAVLVRPVWLS